jgi:alkylation response protein AidB-like acyl-CoA dehydrogenase
MAITSEMPAQTAEGGLDIDALKKAARHLGPALAERASWAEENRRLPQETVDALHDTGLFRTVIPRHLGGYGATLIDQIEIAAELGKSCGSTAWIYTVVGASFPRAFLGEEGQAEICANPRDLVAGVVSPGGVAKSCDGGYRVTGSWGFASGCLHSRWMFGGVIFEDSPEIGPGVVFFPLEEATIKDTWHVAGLCGTGSNTVVAEDLFVPSSRVGTFAERFATDDVFKPDAPPFERWPWAPLATVGLLGPLLGIADGALEIVAEEMGNRGVTGYSFERQTDSGVLLRDLAEATMRIKSAWLHVRAAAEMMDEWTKVQLLDYETRALCRAHGSFAAQELRAAMELLVSISGGSGFAKKNPIQRMWRDLSVGSRHAAINSQMMLEAYGRAKCGVPNITPLI